MKPAIHFSRIGCLRRLCLGLAISAQLAHAGANPPPAAPPTLRIVVLPFQNATGEAAWDDWRQALPALVRSCLDRAEFTRIPRWKTIQPALVRAGWTATSTMDAKLARQMTQELKADVAVWGSFRHLTNGWAVDGKVLRANSEAAPVELHFTSSRWMDLAESLALGLSKELNRPIAADDRQLWRMHLPDSEKAAACLAKAITFETQEAPASDLEKACREVLATDPRCGLAHLFLCNILGEAKRKDAQEEAAREFVRQQPQLCSAHFALARLLGSNHDQEGTERALVAALRVHPGCPQALELMFVLLGGVQQRWADLRKILEQAHTARPDNGNTTILLACARAQSGDIEGARELLADVNDLPEEDETVDLALLVAASLTGKLELAGRELTRLGPQAADSESVRDTLASMRMFDRAEDGGRSHAPVVRPRIFGPEELNADLKRRLTAEERKLVVNPLQLTPELTAEARRLTVGLTNDWLRALALFAEVARHGRGSGDGGRRTASEALKDSGDPQTRFACQEYAKLFVALARALGLEAWLVHIELCADGSFAYHDCAALFLEGQGLLIDPTWRAFGISHRAFTVLDDVQAISHQAMQPGGGKPDPRRLRMGLKLYPEDRWTRLQFVRGMAKAGEHETAAAELRQVQATGAESWDVYEAAAELDIARERWRPALAELQRALELNPSNTVVHVRLATVYGQLNDPGKSTAHMEKAIELDRGELSREFRRESVSGITMMKAIARGGSGDPAVRAELQRQAESGDLAAQMAMAKALFEQKPPRTEEGMRWNLMAAKQGEDQAQFYYAKNLLVLRGAKAGKEATQWFTRSAEQGNDEAQYRLGLILYEGKLVPEDRVAAAQWILLAAAAKNSDARYLLKELQLFLSAAELAEARKRADAFKPVKQPATTPQK